MDENITIFVKSCKDCPKGIYIENMNIVYCKILKRTFYKDVNK
jgi:hypothetical protein